MAGSGDLDALADLFRHFPAGPLYAAICQRVAADPELLALTASAPPAQRRPNLLLAAVHDRLLAGVEDPLADHYPTVAEFSGRPGRPPDEVGAHDLEAAADAFGNFCRHHRDELGHLLATRSTQTNEVGRCTALLPALTVVHRRAGRPLALVDLGASAGLNLLFDRYTYRYHPGGPAGAPGSPVELDCRVRTGQLPEGLGTPPPPVVGRLGLDLSPLDPADPDDARWLLACMWPDDLPRFRRLRAALDLAASARDGSGAPVAPVVRADLTAGFDDRVAGLAPEAALCLTSTWVAAYLTEPEQAALLQAVTDLGRHRPVHWVLAEQPGEVPGLELGQAPPEHADPRATALVLVTADGRRRTVDRLGDLHPHGTWLRWYGGVDGREAPVTTI